MLTISKALNASQAGTYHTKDFVSETQSYYAKDDALLGEWQGHLANRFGLSGTVSKADFMALANGQNPRTGEQMVKHRIAGEQTNPDGSITKTVEHRAGWDATFSAPTPPSRPGDLSRLSSSTIPPVLWTATPLPSSTPMPLSST